jgi:hypothetical protein
MFGPLAAGDHVQNAESVMGKEFRKGEIQNNL